MAEKSSSDIINELFQSLNLPPLPENSDEKSSHNSKKRRCSVSSVSSSDSNRISRLNGNEKKDRRKYHKSKKKKKHKKKSKKEKHDKDDHKDKSFNQNSPHRKEKDSSNCDNKRNIDETCNNSKINSLNNEDKIEQSCITDALIDVIKPNNVIIEKTSTIDPLLDSTEEGDIIDVPIDAIPLPQPSVSQKSIVDPSPKEPSQSIGKGKSIIIKSLKDSLVLTLAEEQAKNNKLEALCENSNETKVPLEDNISIETENITNDHADKLAAIEKLVNDETGHESKHSTNSTDKERKSVKRSRSRSVSDKENEFHNKSRSRSISERYIKSHNRSRSKSPRNQEKRSNRSKSKSLSDGEKKSHKRSRSRSHSDGEKRSHKRSKDRKRSKNRHREISCSQSDDKKYHSKSRNHSRNKSPSRNRHNSPYIPKNKTRSSHRSPSKRKSPSTSKHRSSSRSSRKTSSHGNSKDLHMPVGINDFELCERDKLFKVERQNSPDCVDLLRDKATRRKLLEVAKKNAVYMMRNEHLNINLGKDSGKPPGKSVEELTNFCKQLAGGSDENDGMSDDNEFIGEECDSVKLFSSGRHPFLVKEKPIVMNIRNAPMIKPKSNAERLVDQSKLREQFPVSSGSSHRNKVETGWVPVEKKNEKVFPETENIDINISELVSTRISAMRKLQDDPSDTAAIVALSSSQKTMQDWALSKQVPGQFTGTTGARILSQEELAAGHQAWARKEQFREANPVSSHFGLKMLQKMGWTPGEGLGKHKEGTLEPLLLDVKMDKKGLHAQEEVSSRKVPIPLAKNLAGKHPVSALVELCSKRKWGPPEFHIVFDSGPDHKKNFLMKVIVNRKEYKPSIATSTKKIAKANAAAACLQALGVLPKDPTPASKMQPSTMPSPFLINPQGGMTLDEMDAISPAMIPTPLGRPPEG